MTSALFGEIETSQVSRLITVKLQLEIEPKKLNENV